MQIDRILVRNLASLRGQQPAIALGEAPLDEAGIIAITGPTGAGKSTLLDAVCLALFDETPRLTGKGNDPRELMSRGAAEAQAQVELTLDDGARWRADWSVHRARGRFDGALQASRVRVTDVATGQTLAEGKRGVRELVEQRLGLTFEQFTGVILLAQGDFAKFLKATEQERSALLEKLTGTDLYSRLSQAAYERHQEALRRRDEIAGKAAAIQLLSHEERLHVETELAGLGSELVEHEKRAERAERCVRWFERAAELEARATVAEEARAAAEAEHARATPDRERLSLADAASPLAPALAAADAAKAREGEFLRRAAEAQEGADRASVATGKALDALALALGRAEGIRDGADRARQRLRGLEAVPRERILTAETLWGGVRGSTEEVSRLRRWIEELRAEGERLGEGARSAEEGAREARRTHGADALALARLEERIGEIEAGGSYESLLEERQALLQALEVVHALEKLGLSHLRERSRTASETLDRSLRTREADGRVRDEALLDVRRREELLGLAREGAKAAGYRHLLREGEPCPLCGAVDHPFGRGRAPGTDEALRLAEAELARCKEAAGKAEESARRAAEHWRAAELDEAKARAGVADAEERATRLRERWRDLGRRLVGLPAEPAGGEQLLARGTEVRSRLEELKGLRTEAQRLGERVRKAAAEEAEANRRLAVAGQKLEDHGRRAAEAQTAQEAAEARARQAEEAWSEARSLLARECGEDPAPVEPSAWLARLRERRTAWEAAERRSERAHVLTQELGSTARTRFGVQPSGPTVDADPDDATVEGAGQALRTALEAAAQARSEEQVRRREAHLAQAARVEAAEESGAAQAALASALEGSWFVDAASLRGALLPSDRVLVLRQRSEAVERARARASLAWEEARRERGAHEASAPEHGIDLSADRAGAAAAAGAALTAARAERDAAQAQRGALEEKLRGDAAAQERRALLGRDLGEADAARDRAARLNDLIGQKDGGKFRRFAQALNLDRLLALANRRLTNLAPRYSLARVPESLDIEVLDHELAGEHRGVATLSGGESFLVSLALALALADLRRGSLRLGTLFLDEGFGTLDAETLDQALSVLEELQARQGTRILVISHVEALKERIGHRIELHKLGGGRSSLRVVGE